MKTYTKQEIGQELLNKTYEEFVKSAEHLLEVWQEATDTFEITHARYKYSEYLPSFDEFVSSLYK